MAEAQANFVALIPDTPGIVGAADNPGGLGAADTPGDVGAGLRKMQPAAQRLREAYERAR